MTKIEWKGLHCFVPKYGECYPGRVLDMSDADASQYVAQGKAEYLKDIIEQEDE